MDENDFPVLMFCLFYTVLMQLIIQAQDFSFVWSQNVYNVEKIKYKIISFLFSRQTINVIIHPLVTFFALQTYGYRNIITTIIIIAENVLNMAYGLELFNWIS